MEHKKHDAEKARGLFKDPVKVVLVLIIIALLAYIAMKPQEQPPSNEQQGGSNQTAKKANATIELFVMSQCPYGVQAEVLIEKVISKFKGEVNLSLHFIANENAEGGFSSLHGQTEVDEDIRQVCIMKYYPEKLWNYLLCVASNYTNVAGVWESCAAQNGIDKEKIRSCSTGEEGKALLRENIKRTNELGVTASPTIFLNGQPYSGLRDESSITRAICELIPSSETCKNIPPEVSVELIVINDDNCLLCDPSGIENSLKGLIPNLKIKELDYSKGEGKALVERLGISALPVYLFNSSITQHSSYETLSRYLIRADSYYIINVQPVKLLDRVEENNTVQLFVMSQCPYGTMAERAMKELLDAVPEVKFRGLYFIANEVGNGTFQSLHGQTEVDEDIRQVCIMKYYPEKLWNYLLCVASNYTNVAGVWESCAAQNGIDKEKIRSCSTGEEGKALLRENIKRTNELGIGSSPTIMLNNNTLFSTIYAEQMKQVVCAYNPVMEGCNKTLSGAGATAPSGGCG
ncbi:MAG: thioredoxin domain-containing protein [Candidatus Micrarchaeia archaeon]